MGRTIKKTRALSKEAEEDMSDEVETVDILPTKAGILQALTEFASHADNG